MPTLKHLATSILPAALLAGCGLLHRQADAADVRVCSDLQQLSDANTTHVDAQTFRAMKTIALGDARNAHDARLRDSAVAVLSSDSPSDATTMLARCASIGHTVQLPVPPTTDTTVP